MIACEVEVGFLLVVVVTLGAVRLDEGEDVILVSGFVFGEGGEGGGEESK